MALLLTLNLELFAAEYQAGNAGRHRVAYLNTHATRRQAKRGNPPGRDRRG